MNDRAPVRFDRSIVECPISRAVWKLARPTMLQNMIRGLQGTVDQAMVGRFVGYTASATIGVARPRAEVRAFIADRGTKGARNAG